MAFLDEMDRKLTQLSRNAVQKTKELTESARIAGEMNELEQKIQTVYGEIGKKFVMELQPGSMPAEYGALYNQLCNLQMKLEELRRMQSAGSNSISCPNCRAQIPADSVFCNHCGTNLQQNTNGIALEQPPQIQPLKPRPDPMVTAVCPNCGAGLKENQLFCINCGTKVEQIRPSKPEPEKKSMEQSEETDVSDITELISGEEAEGMTLNETPLTCRVCGAEIKEGQVFCINCGEKL